MANTDFSEVNENFRLYHGKAEAVRNGDSEIRPSERRRREAYFNSTRVPRIFCEVIELRNDGSSRSISSKKDDNAGVCVF